MSASVLSLGSCVVLSLPSLLLRRLITQPALSQRSRQERFLLMHQELQYKAAHYEVGLGEGPTMIKPFGSWVLLERKWRL